MKTKHLLLFLAALVATAGFWTGRMIWRVRHQLVTLDVREAPLNQVLRSIARQTWTKIRAEQSLADTRVTLHVANMPLRDVLTRIAGQAGARWSTIYAVSDSPGALRSLDAALVGDGKLEPAGWTRLAPNLPVPDPADPSEPGPVIRREPGPEGAPEPHRIRIVRNGPSGPTVLMGGPNSQVEVWSPEELVIPTPLKARFTEDPSQSPSAAEAAATAQKVNGKWTTYLAFRKSSLGVGFAAMPPTPGPAGPTLRLPNPSERFVNLTPAQRVQRARGRSEVQAQ
jgi:hypothetical protein